MGLLLGNPRDGFLAGALLQMLFLGMITVRGSRMPDLTLGGVTASSVYILAQREAGSDPGVKGFVLFISLAAALGVAVIGCVVHRFWERHSFFLARWGMRSAEKGRFWLASALHFSTIAIHGIVGFAIVAGAVIAGVPLASAAIAAVPGHWCEPFVSLSVLVPFIGAGSLLALNLTRVRIFLFGAGFVIVLLVRLFRG
jgi:mannose/fructose/N-acetylgalactosamine-specific phosphotransferase system component IIC